MPKFNANSANVENLQQMMRLIDLQRWQNKLHICREENPALYYGLVKLVWSSIPLAKRRRYNSV